MEQLVLKEGEAVTRRRGLDVGKKERVLPVTGRGLLNCLRVGKEGGDCLQTPP